MKISELFENSKKQQKTSTKPQVDLGPQLDLPQSEPIQPYREPEKQRDSEPVVPPRSVASQSQTLRKTQGLSNDEMARMLSRMRDIESDIDDPGYPDETNTEVTRYVTTDNLPAVAGANLQAAGVQNPEWHKVANLPGNMQEAFRILGQKLFLSMTTTPTDEIHMIGNLGGSGPNTTQEVNAVTNWIEEHGQYLSSGEIDFSPSIPEYRVKIIQYTAGGIRWLLVKDQFGRYIYSWPESDSKQHSNQESLPHNRLRLPNRD